jgi:hypothetical protein
MDSWAPIEVLSGEESEFNAPNDLASDVSITVREPVVEVRPYSFPSEIVPDPDFVVSPAEALEEARRRIAQMRASLQTNINRVSQSFEHPIFTPVEVSVQEAPPFVPVADLKFQLLSWQNQVQLQLWNQMKNQSHLNPCLKLMSSSRGTTPVAPAPVFTQSATQQQSSKSRVGNDRDSGRAREFSPNQHNRLHQQSLLMKLLNRRIL